MRMWIKAINTAFASCFLVVAIQLSPIAAKPSFLIIAIDDLNDYVGCMDGHPNASTPNLDRLAQEGVLFTNAHCNSPVYNPSRASLWTGLRPTTTGITANPSGWFRDRPGFENVVTLSQAMGRGGYSTYGYGKLYHPKYGEMANGYATSNTITVHYNLQN